MKNKTNFYLCLILIGAALLRACYLLVPHMDSDQAIFGLVGWHVLQGEFPIFQWSYHYMGTLQSYIDAIFFAIFGLKRTVLNTVPLLLSLIFILVTYRLGKELLDKKTGLIAALISAFGPYYLVLHGAWARHGYLETMIFGSILMILTTKILKLSPKDNLKKYYMWFGFIAGIGWWTNFLIVYYIFPCSIFLLFHNKKLFFQKNIILMGLMFFIGSLPFWIYNFTHSFASLSIFLRSHDAEVSKHMVKFFQYKLPVILGARERAAFGWKIAVYLFYSFTFVWLITRKHPRTLFLPAFFAISLFILLSLSFYGNENTQRHLLPLYSVIPIFLARVFVTLKEKSKTFAYSFLTVLFILNLNDNALSIPILNPQKIKRFQEDLATKKKLKETLVNKEIYGSYTYNYWVGPALTFDCEEKVVFPHPYRDRYPLYTRKTMSLWNPAYTTVGGNKHFEEIFKNLNVTYKKFDAAPFIFYSYFKKNGPSVELISNKDWKCTSSNNNAFALRAVDGNMRSAWMSSSKQTKGMTLTIELPKSEMLSRIDLYLGRALYGAPKKIKVFLSRNNKNWNEINDIPHSFGFFWDGTHPIDHGLFGKKEINFKPQRAKFIQFELEEANKQHPDYWAYAEIALYRAKRTPYKIVQPKEVDNLISYISKYPKYQIYASPWLSAYLGENYSSKTVIETWKAPSNKENLKKRILDFSKSTIFVATDENKYQIEEALTKQARVSFKKENLPPYTIFVVEESPTPNRYFWTGTELYKWKRIPKS